MTVLMGSLPIGYNMVPAGVFEAGGVIGTPVEEFAMKQTPVTNVEWAETVESLDEDTYVLLDHDWETGQTNLRSTGKDIPSALRAPIAEPVMRYLEMTRFDSGEVAMLGGQILLKMVGSPSAQYDDEEEGRIFSGARQPVVGVSYFHAKAWCLLETIKSAGKWLYDLPTDNQFYYVASDRGTNKYATSTGSSHGPDGKMLFHIEANQTVAVDDPLYEPAKDRPFGIDVVGNVWRRLNFYPAFKKGIGEFLKGPYCSRGGSWNHDQSYAQVVTLRHGDPRDHSNDIGFSPVVTRQGLKSKP